MPRRELLLLSAIFVLLLSCGESAVAAGPERIFLHKDWQVQSSCETKATAAEISAAGFDAKGWHHSDLPNTVVGALVADKTYPDPDYGTNFQSFPGFSHDRQHFFANVDVPKDSPFHCSWWFRTEFTPPADFNQGNKWLHFLGINYRANVWLNGQKIADANEVAGTFATFEFNVSKSLHSGGPNALAVEVSAPGKNDLG